MILVPVIFGVLFALALIGPVSELISLPAFYAYYGVGDATPWAILVAGVALPVVLYVLALLLGRGRPPFARALILTVALAAAFALRFGTVELVFQLQPALGG